MAFVLVPMLQRGNAVSAAPAARVGVDDWKTLERLDLLPRRSVGAREDQSPRAETPISVPAAPAPSSRTGPSGSLPDTPENRPLSRTSPLIAKLHGHGPLLAQALPSCLPRFPAIQPPVMPVPAAIHLRASFIPLNVFSPHHTSRSRPMPTTA